MEPNNSQAKDLKKLILAKKQQGTQLCLAILWFTSLYQSDNLIAAGVVGGAALVGAAAVGTLAVIGGAVIAKLVSK